MTYNPIIVALDVDSAGEARSLVKTLGDSIDFYKVGMELYAAAGMAIVRELIDQGKRVFLDLKYYDIPETVKRAVAQVSRSGATFLTVHAVGSVMRAAVEGRRAISNCSPSPSSPAWDARISRNSATPVKSPNWSPPAPPRPWPPVWMG